MMFRPTVLFGVWFVLLLPCKAFTATTQSEYSSNRRPTETADLQVQLVNCQLDGNNDQNEMKPLDLLNLHTPDPSKKKVQNKEDNKKKKGLSIFLLNTNFAFAYLTMALGALLSLGLLLNILGYGYQITPEGELRIDALQQLREEAQFRQEVAKSMKEYRQQQDELLRKAIP